MKTVAIAQSNYLPWKGYFDLIHDVDVFLFYDDVQFTKNDWRNRNKVKTPTGLQWLTIPVGTNLRRRICDVTIETVNWQRKHFKTLVQLYEKAPFFGLYREFLEDVYTSCQWSNLSQLNQALIRRIATQELGIRTCFHQASEFLSSGTTQDRVISLLKAVDADIYVSGPAGKAYLDPNRFRQEGIQLVWKDYSGYPEYPQVHPPFQHAVTILDLLFHVGDEASYYIWGWREGRRELMSA